MSKGDGKDMIVADEKASSDTNFILPNQDRKSIFYVHASDAPGSFLVSKKLVSETNFYQWQCAMKVALVSRQKLGFTTGDIVKPPVDSKDREAWETCNGLVLSWLFNAVEPEIATTLLYTDVVAVIWKDLEDRYKITNKPQIFQMKYDISTMSQGEDNVCIYFQKLKSLWDQLDSCIKKPIYVW